MFDYVVQNRHTCLKPSSFFLQQLYETNSNHVFQLFTLPADMFDTVAPDQLARRLQLNSTSTHVSTGCFNQLQLTCKHICSCGAEPAGCHRPIIMTLCSYTTDELVSTLAPDDHACTLQSHHTNSHVFMSCILSAYMSVTVSCYQHACIIHLNQTISHVYSQNIFIYLIK